MVAFESSEHEQRETVHVHTANEATNNFLYLDFIIFFIYGLNSHQGTSNKSRYIIFYDFRIRK